MSPTSWKPRRTKGEHNHLMEWEHTRRVYLLHGPGRSRLGENWSTLLKHFLRALHRSTDLARTISCSRTLVPEVWTPDGEERVPRVCRRKRRFLECDALENAQAPPLLATRHAPFARNGSDL